MQTLGGASDGSSIAILCHLCGSHDLISGCILRPTGYVGICGLSHQLDMRFLSHTHTNKNFKSNTTISHTINKSERHYTKQNKPRKEKHWLISFTCGCEERLNPWKVTRVENGESGSKGTSCRYGVRRSQGLLHSVRTGASHTRLGNGSAEGMADAASETEKATL